MISFFEIGTDDAEKARAFYGGLFEEWTFHRQGVRPLRPVRGRSGVELRPARTVLVGEPAAR